MNFLKDVLLGLIILLVVSCNKDGGYEISSTKENILNNNAFVLDSTKVLSSTGNSFVLSSSASKKPKVGEIILSGPSVNCPHGMLRKIISLSETSTQISYQTEQSSLNEAFKQLYIDQIHSESYSESSKFSRIAGDGTNLTLTFNNSSVGNGVKLNGQIKLKYPTTTFKYEKLPNSNEPQLVILKTDLSVVESNLEMTNSGSSPISIPKFILSSYGLPPITVIIPIGGFPFPLKFKQKIDFEILPFEINGKFNFKILPSVSATLGAQFAVNVGWTNISTYNFNATTSSSFTNTDYLKNGSVNAQLTIFNPKYSISPMFVDELKATLEFPIRLNLKVQGNQPNYSLKSSVGAKGAIEQKFFRNLQGTYSISGDFFEKIIVEGNWQTNNNQPDYFLGKWKLVSAEADYHFNDHYYFTHPTFYAGIDSTFTNYLVKGTWYFGNSKLSVGANTYEIISFDSDNQFTAKRVYTSWKEPLVYFRKY